MDLFLNNSASLFLAVPPVQSNCSFSVSSLLTPHLHRRWRKRLPVRCNLGLPFLEQEAKYHRELEAAVNAVQSACHICVDVQKSLFSPDGKIVEKNDQTPVTVADFGVQALISLELSKLLPSIPLVAEEDSAFLRSNNLVGSVVNVVTNKASFGDKPTQSDVLEAIDRGGKGAVEFGPKPATYWVLDPIDGTRGFVKCSGALYVVGLALVVEGEIVLGVMACPNWLAEKSVKSVSEDQQWCNVLSGSGIIMVSHIGCGTWRKRLSNSQSSTHNMLESWTRCFVDGCSLVQRARFCIPESQTWESLPLSSLFDATTNAEYINDRQVHLLSICCGSLCKYMMVASGGATVFIVRARAQRTIKVWDHAAGMICVHEAGGKVTDWMGSQLDLAADQIGRRSIFPSGGVLATNSNVHDQIIGLIHSTSVV